MLNNSVGIEGQDIDGALFGFMNLLGLIAGCLKGTRNQKILYFCDIFIRIHQKLFDVVLQRLSALRLSNGNSDVVYIHDLIKKVSVSFHFY
jgi:hypothetical protein